MTAGRHLTLLARSAHEYVRTTKPRILALFLLTGWTGLFLGGDGAPTLWLTVGTLSGIGLTVGGAASLNSYLERDVDRLMERTRDRPLPAGVVSSGAVLVLALLLVGTGTATLWVTAGAAPAALAAGGAAYYVVVYTMLLKPRTPYSPVPGGLAGVAPALVGWFAARSEAAAMAGPSADAAYLDAVYLAVLIFLWSPPHFWSLALARVGDYRRAGIPSLPNVRGEWETRRQIAAHSFGLVAVSLLPVAAGRLGSLYLIGAVAAGVLLLHRLALLWRDSSASRARAFFRYSGVYLMAILTAMLVDRVLGAGPAWADSPTMLRPESTQARDIRDLALIVLVISSGILLVVEGILLTAIIRFRRRPESEVRQQHGNQTLEIVWTVIPAIIVVVLLSLTIRTMNSLELPGGALPVRVVGHQWWWEFGYPQSGVYLANEIHVPEGRAVDFALESADVIHSFWVPQLGGKTDMNPGHVTRAGFMAATPGTYLGECAEFCGLEHARMRFYLIVESPEAFSAWIAHQAEPAAEPRTPEQEAGREVYLSKPCQGCHAIRTTPADPDAPAPAPALAPDLTHFGSRLSIAAGTLENTAENLRAWLRDPQKVKPGELMPTPDVTEAELDHLAAYLESLE